MRTAVESTSDFKKKKTWQYLTAILSAGFIKLRQQTLDATSDVNILSLAHQKRKECLGGNN